MLTRRTGPDGEQRVTTRPAARPPDKIRKILCWALALALWGGSSWSVGVSFQCGCLLSSAFAVAPTLRTPPLLALRAGPIMLARMPAPPAPGCLLAIFTAITSLRMGRMEPPLTAFQKTASAAKLPRPLNGRAPRQILRWAHGRLHSRRSSLGEKCRLFSEAFLFVDNSLQFKPLAAIAQGRPTPRPAAKTAPCMAAINTRVQTLQPPIGLRVWSADSRWRLPGNAASCRPFDSSR